MFVAVVGMPHRLEDGTWWDGKIGMFPLTEIGFAVNNSVHRPAGTEVIKCLSVTAEVYRNMMLKAGGVYDAIKEKMAWAKGATITLQHDGAPGHNKKGNLTALNEAGGLDGWDIVIDTQPAQSPDLNLCDLCFFSSLQSASFSLRSECHTPAQLITNVMQAWDEYPWEALERAWGLLHSVYRSVLDDGGGNMYAMPHSGVKERQRDGGIVCDRVVPLDLKLKGSIALAALNDNN
jgi:hypothetical protein